MHELVIRDATLVDGTGAPARPADVAVDDGRITEVTAPGKLDDASATRTVDADGLLVTPGFVDLHTHYDGQVTWDPLLSPSCWHGVTTVVMGNCGVGFAPVRPGQEDWLIQLMEGVEDIPGTALNEGITWGWETFPEYLDALDTMPARHGRRHAGAARRGARVRDGGSRCPQRARHPRGHRGHGQPRARGHQGRRARLLDLAHDHAQGGRRRTGARHVRGRGRAVRHRPGARRARHRAVRARTRGRDGGGPRRAREGSGVDAPSLRRHRPAGELRAVAAQPRPRPVARRAAPGAGGQRRGRRPARSGGRSPAQPPHRLPDLPPVPRAPDLPQARATCRWPSGSPSCAGPRSARRSWPRHHRRARSTT